MSIWHNWCILSEISRHIDFPKDFAAFAGVNTFCRSAAVKKNFKFGSKYIPWLMIPPKQANNNHIFFSLSNGSCMQMNLPDAFDNRCYSSKGWLLVIDKVCNLFLLHPLSNTRIDLPHMTTFPNFIQSWGEDWADVSAYMQIFFIRKFLLSANPEQGNYTVLVMCDGPARLAFCRPGLTSWIDIDTGCANGTCDDVIYFRNKFYCIYGQGTIVAIDMKPDNRFEYAVIVDRISPEHLEFRNIEKFYLVKSEGKLFVIHRPGWLTWTEGFHVLEVDLENKSLLAIKDLGFRSMFLGDNSSLCVEVFDETGGVKSNCIYFSDDCAEHYYDPDTDRVREGGGKNMGVYDLRDGSVKNFDRPGYETFGAISLPMWVEQSF